MTASPDFVPGLQGVIAAETRLSSVNGQIGELIIAGYPLESIAPNASFEEMVYLLWNDHLPNAQQLKRFQGELAAFRKLPQTIIAVLREAASQQTNTMDALRIAASMLSLRSSDEPESPDRDALALIARFPAIVAAYWRLLKGNEPVEARTDLSHAANYLYMLTGEEPSPERSRALETYLGSVVDHGLNASTFTARVIISTQSDLVSAIVGAVGALKGPLHGGAPGPALDMVFEIGTADRAESVIRRKLEAGERLMGFGHRVYKVRDPRADVLAQASELLYRADGDLALYELAKSVEATAIRLLEEYKPGRKLQTNVEFYTALVLHGIGLPSDLFSPTFAVSRAAGWIAHAFEQQDAGRIIRPTSVYVGPTQRQWIPLERRP